MANVHDKIGNVQEQVVNAMERVGEAAQSVGQKVTDFFQGNPFETPVGRKIELATDATKLATENWGLNMEICDFVNCTNEGPRDAIRAIKKRLQTQMGKNNAIVMYTLTVLETCVKNCDMRFTALVCQKDFVSELVKLVSAKYDAPQIVQERVLALIQSWADAFRGNPALVGVVEMYDELRAKGVEFPATDLDTMAPIITPKQTVFTKDDAITTTPAQATPQRAATQTFPTDLPFAQTQPVLPKASTKKPPQQAPSPPTGPLQLSAEQMAKLRSELDIVNVNMEVLRELVGKMKPGGGGGGSTTNATTQGQPQQQEPPEDFHFMQELHSTCKEMQKRILDLIPVVTNEEVTYELLSVNDELNATFEKVDRCMANFNQQGIDLTMVAGGSGTSAAPSAQPPQSQPQPSAVMSAGNNNIDDLIDLGPNAGKPLSEQFQAIDIHGNAGSQNSTSPAAPAAAYVHDQAEVGIHAVAFNKPEPSTVGKEEEPAQRSSKKPLLEDDGL